MEYPFSDAPNTATIICSHIAKNKRPILYVSHDADDGMWQFLCGEKHEESEARIVSLYWVFEHDYSVAELAEMPCGYFAERQSEEMEWVIRRE